LYRADKQRIAEIYGPASQEKLPKRWIALIEKETRPSPLRNWSQAAMAIAASVALVFGLTFVFEQSAAPPKGDIVADALAVRANEIGPHTMIAVRSLAEAQAQADAMSKVLATRVRIPDLSRAGYHLVGIESYNSPASSFQLVYRDALSRVFTLYVRRASGATRFDQFARNGLNICVWQDESLGVVMAGRMSDAEMQRLEPRAFYGLEG
jgi:anti-sigma factor RsiW